MSKQIQSGFNSFKHTFKSHISSVKHKKSCEKNLLQPSIAGGMVTANAKEKKDDIYALKLATAFVESGIPFWKLRHPSIKQFFLQQHKEVLPTKTFYNKNF